VGTASELNRLPCAGLLPLVSPFAHQHVLTRPGACTVVQPTWRASRARWCLVARYEKLRCVRAVRTARHSPWRAHTAQARTTGPAPLRVRRAGIHLCRRLLQYLTGDAPRAPPGRVWHRHLRGGSVGPSKGEAFQEILCTEERPWQRRGEGQQLGRTRQRERRGSTGKAGRSKAGERLAIRLFIDGLLLCRSLGHCRHQPYRYGDICSI
jgi:hypothetical protein